MITVQDITNLTLEVYRTSDRMPSYMRHVIGLQMLADAFKYQARGRSKAANEARRILRAAAKEVCGKSLLDTEEELAMFGGVPSRVSSKKFRVPVVMK